MTKLQRKSSTVTAAILAGGRARRLGGRDKGLALLQNKPLVEHVLPLLQRHFDHVVINANRNQAEYAHYGVPVINDQLDNYQGPLAGILPVMQSVNTRYILVLPCDTPSINTLFITRFLDKLATINDEAILIAFDGDREQYLHALMPVALSASLLTFLEQGGRSVRYWYAEHKVYKIDFSDCPQIFDNINTRQELEEAQTK